MLLWMCEDFCHGRKDLEKHAGVLKSPTSRRLSTDRARMLTWLAEEFFSGNEGAREAYEVLQNHRSTFTRAQRITRSKGDFLSLQISGKQYEVALMFRK